MRPGAWRVRAFVGKDPISGHPRQVERTVHGTQAQARAALKQLVAKRDSGAHGGAKATLGFVLDEYARHAEARGRSARYLADIRRVAKRVIPADLARTEVGKLTARHLDELYRRLAMGEVPGLGRQSASSIVRHHAVISAALSRAVKWGWLERNPALSADPPSVPALELKVLTPEQVRTLVSGAARADERYGVLALLALLTATRLGEFCALKWSSIDEEAGAVWIRRALYRAGSERGEKETKGKRSRRVALTPQLLTVLDDWRVVCEQRAAAAGVALVEDSFIVAASPNGARPVNPETFSAFMSRLARAHGWRISDYGRNPFRHFGGTEIMAALGSARDGAAVLGHADPAFFLRRYTHPTTERERAAAEVLGRVLELPGAPE